MSAIFIFNETADFINRTAELADNTFVGDCDFRLGCRITLTNEILVDVVLEDLLVLVTYRDILFAEYDPVPFNGGDF